MNALEHAALSRDEARSLTDEVKNDAERLWRKLVELYEGGAHEVLGYSDWGSYFETEFGQSRVHGYRLLKAAAVVDALGSNPGVTEKHARELVPLLDKPEVMRDTWAEVVELHPEPTAADVREVVARRQAESAPRSHKAVLNANADKRRLHGALSSIEGYCMGLADFNVERALSTASAEDLAAWEGLAGKAVAELNRLRRALKEGSK